MLRLPELAFRGDRDYLTGATIFDRLVENDAHPRHIDIAFYKMTGRQCTVMPNLTEETQESLVATYKSDGLTCFLYEGEALVQSRDPCNEQSILQHVRESESAIEFAMPPIPGATFVESIVAVYKKRLLDSEPNLTRKLVFARLLLDSIPAGGECRVEHRRKIGEDFFEARLSVDGQRIGKLFFGLI